MHIDIAVPAGGAGESFAHDCFVERERAVQSAGSYRGKILSLESDPYYSGRSRGLTVHRWPRVDGADVILPEKVLKLLDRNVLSFVGMRDALRRLGQSTRKGILLYGPPGTGKTHTIRYLATNLADQTTLITAAGEVGALGVNMNLARLLQPALVVIEDVDLIARDRIEMRDAREELMLNNLLNEMDGLKEDADILFLLTTYRLEELEDALAARPGRIDQVIEVPLPDAGGRDKLVRLYGKHLPLTEPLSMKPCDRARASAPPLSRSSCGASRNRPSRAMAAKRSSAMMSIRHSTICYRGGGTHRLPRKFDHEPRQGSRRPVPTALRSRICRS
ncbi:DNA polymerase III delta prime subunit [Bradyrhizobium sp. USDA 4448]